MKPCLFVVLCGEGRRIMPGFQGSRKHFCEGGISCEGNGLRICRYEVLHTFGYGKRGEIWILRTGRNRVKPHYSVGPKVSENYASHFVLNGMVSLAYGDEEVTLSAGDVFCLFPHTRYSYWEPNGHLEPARAHAVGRFGWRIDRHGFEPDRPHACKPYVHNAMKGELQAVLDQMNRCVDNDTVGNEFARQKWLYRLFEPLAGAAVQKGVNRTGLSKASIIWIPITWRDHRYGCGRACRRTPDASVL